ncbi:DUF5417 domain-containing protein [Enterobacter hormaechei]
MKLVRHTTSDMAEDYETRSRHWGQKHYFLIENAPAEQLEAIEDMLAAAGWESDGCPCYEDGFTSGFHIEIDEVPAFKEAYKAAKKGLKAYMEQKAIEEARAAESANRQKEFFGMPDHKQAFAIESAHAAALVEAEEIAAAEQERINGVEKQRTLIISGCWDDEHAEALELDAVFRKAKARFDHFWNDFSAPQRRRKVEAAHAAALEINSEVSHYNETADLLLERIGNGNSEPLSDAETLQVVFWMNLNSVQREEAVLEAHREALAKNATFDTSFHRRAANWGAMDWLSRQVELEKAEIEAYALEAEFEASPLKRLLNASDHLNPASDALIEFLERSPIVAPVYKHRNPNIDERFVVTPRTVYVVYDEANKRCKRLAEVKPEQIIANGLCFQMETSCESYTPLSGVVANDDNPIMGDYLDNLLATMFVIPVVEPEDEDLEAVKEAMHVHHENFTTPEMTLEGDEVWASWTHKGEKCKDLVYAGTRAEEMHAVCVQMNADEESYWRDQQKAEQAAEARNERWFEEGNGLGAMEFEDRMRQEKNW